MMQTIQYGSEGNIVKAAKYLTGYNYYGKAGSRYDKAFRSYIAEWKTEHGLTSSDVIGDKTWSAIAENAPDVNGKNKEACAAFQIINGLTVNGVYNTATKNLIKAYQTLAGLKVDGICNTSTWKEVITTSPSYYRHTANYKQNDSRWSSVIYSRSGKATGQTIGNSACAPTSVASILKTFGYDVTPVEIAELAVKSGYRKNSGGTDTAFFPYVARKYGLKCVSSTNKQLFRYCLDKGGYPICRFKAKSWWTSCGHYSPAWKYDSTYYYVDNTISNIKVKRKLSYLLSDCREFFLFMK